MTNKANNPDASTKQSDKRFDAIEQGAHDAGKPIEPKEGNGFHSGRKVPTAEAVREIDPEKNAGAAIAAAKRQNTMDDGQLAQIPAGKKFPTSTSSGN